MSDFLSWAIRYGNMGLSVFPLLPRDKKPYGALLPQKVDPNGVLLWIDDKGNETLTNTGKPKSSWSPFQTRRADDDQILTWWYDAPQANIGIATGAVSGIVVLDVDEAAGEDEIKRHGLPAVLPTVRTGKGRHLYFKHPGRKLSNFARKLPGLDFRGDGGYVVAPPSIHPSGAVYQWEVEPEQLDLPDLPNWLLNLFTAETPRQPGNGSTDHPAYASAAIQGELAVLAAATAGSRNDTLNICALKLGSLIASGLLSRPEVENALLSGALALGLTEHESRGTIRSGIEKGLTQPRTVPTAKPSRPDPSPVPIPPVVNDDSDVISIGEVSKLAKANAIAWANDPRDIRGLATGIEELDQHLGGLLPNDIVIILGRTGGGKSALAVHMMAALGLQSPGIVFTTEMVPEWYVHRLASYKAGINAKQIWNGQAGKNPDLLKAYDSTLQWPISFYKHDNPVPALLVKKAEWLKANGGQWMIVDSLNNVSTPGQSIYDGTKTVMSALRHIARGLGITVIATCQANRGPADRKNKEPLINDAQGGGTIEQDSTRFLSIYRPGYDLETHQVDMDTSIDPNIVYLSIVKDRFFSNQGKRVDLYWSANGGYTKCKKQSIDFTKF